MTREQDKKPSREQQLLEAARLGHFNQLDTILSQLHQLKTKKRSNPLASLKKCIGVNNIRDSVTGFTCLHHAALNGNAQCVQLILNHGARLNAVDYKGSSALHLAAWSGNLEAVRVLLSYCAPKSSSTSARQTTMANIQPGSDRSHSSSSSSSISQTAIDDRHYQHQQAQSNKLSSPRTKPRQQNENQLDHQHEELELDLRNNDGQTALSLAAQFGHSQVVAELLCRSADVNQRNNQLESALDLACLNGNLESVRLLLDSSPQLVHALRHSHSFVAMDLRASFPAGQLAAANQRQSTKSGWSSLLRGGGDSLAKTSSGKDSDRPQRRASLAPAKIQEESQHNAFRCIQQSSLDLSLTPTGSERLLDHSPLHYAVRGCHLNVISLLLDHYEANLFQLTSRGSVFHEIVLNINCDPVATSRNNATAAYYTNGEMMRLFLARLSRISAGDLEATRLGWNQLLGTRNSQQMSVFDLINEFNNNRPVQELKRNIFELNEQIQRSLQIQQRQLNQSAQSHNSNELDQRAAVAAAGQQQQYFSNARQMNSFLTMNRARHLKQQQQQQQPEASSMRPTMKDLEAHNLVSNNDENKFHRHAISGTQTIDRRRIVGSRGCRNQESSEWLYDTSSFSNQQAPITRSVSNLVNVNSSSNETAMRQAQLYGSVEIDWLKLMSNRGQNEVLNVQEVQQRIDQVHKQQQQQANVLQTKKRRSKSRDLGSLLMEINQNQQYGSEMQSSMGASMEDAEQLYDNQLGSEQLYQQTNQPHLVRSQTDCSHLLGKLTSGSDLHLATDQQHLGLRDKTGDSARYHQFHLQHQPRSSDNSSSMLTGNSHHNESRRLVPTTIAQQHSATLDRRAINRHYHVYDHEFYPPRLVTDQTILVQAKGHHHHPITPIRMTNATTASERQKQAAVAIVPPFVRSDLNSQQVAIINRVDAIGGENHTRLSLNIVDQRPKKLDQREQIPALANMSERQLEQMNRFASVSSRKSMPIHGAPSDQYGQQQTGLIADSDYNIQQLALHNSQSFDSHFDANSAESQRQLFESRRQALLQDFNQVIDHELLLRHDNLHSSRSSLGPIAHSASSSSQGSSILTGVSLDMDLQGEHLIVSGTRVTMPPATPQQEMRSATTSSFDAQQPAQQSEAIVGQVNITRNQRPTTSLRANNERSGNETKIDNKCQMSNSPDSLASVGQRQPPQKPPRPSLKSKQIYKSLQLEVATDLPGANTESPGSETSSIIYDQPSVCSQSSASQQQQPAGRRSSSSSVLSPSTLMQAPMPLLATPMSKVGQSQSSITEPPSERPPPPPQPARAQPMSNNSTLNVITTNLRSDPLSSSSSHSSATSSSCTSFRQFESNASREGQPNRVTTVAGVEASATQHCADVDSGFCTSNSPASNVSESGLNATECEPQEPTLLEAIWSKPSTSRAASVVSVASPPSPRTAQMSIEEALVPLDESSKTHEIANQTEQIVLGPSNTSLLYERLSEICQVSSDANDQRDDSSKRLDDQVGTIFNWLKVTPDCDDQRHQSRRSECADLENDAGNYENCIDLQRKLCSINVAQLTSDSGKGIDLTRSLPLPKVQNGVKKTCAENDSGENFNKALNSLVEQTDGSCNGQSLKQCKEIMLKVVIDHNNKLDNCDEVFYINPIELKKITKSKEDTNETQTLTDEELCASVDKESGYIRFTLRKRREMTDSSGQQQAAPEADLLKSYNSPQTNNSSAKRTKMNQEQVDMESSSSSVTSNHEEPTKGIPAAESESNNENKRKPSADSLQMDTSQASSSSSTSSEMSIKSIVSLRVQKLAGQEIGHGVELADGATDKSSQVETQQADTNRGANEVSLAQRRPKSSSLLVSEVVKKVDASVQKPPVAVMRRNLGQLGNNTQNPSRTETRPKNVAPLRRSICWPPPKPGDDESEPTSQEGCRKSDESSKSMSPPVMGRVTANRLSFQRLIEEQNRNNCLSSATTRSKPAPPVKPASLVATQLLRSQANK